MAFGPAISTSRTGSVRSCRKANSSTARQAYSALAESFMGEQVKPGGHHFGNRNVGKLTGIVKKDAASIAVWKLLASIPRKIRVNDLLGRIDVDGPLSSVCKGKNHHSRVLAAEALAIA